MFLGQFNPVFSLTHSSFSRSNQARIHSVLTSTPGSMERNHSAQCVLCLAAGSSTLDCEEDRIFWSTFCYQWLERSQIRRMGYFNLQIGCLNIFVLSFIVLMVHRFSEYRSSGWTPLLNWTKFGSAMCILRLAWGRFLKSNFWFSYRMSRGSTIYL